MPARRETQEYIEKELPYKLLAQLYENSRESLRELGGKLGISYHVIQSTLKELENKYKLTYSLELNETKLGFGEGRIITIKFGIKPNLDSLKEMLQKDIFVQNAYLSEGDFDLLLYVVGLAPEDFQGWQWGLRTKLSKYKPIFKSANVSNKVIGFFPLRNDLIKESTVLSKTEKEVLALLNENSRIKLSEIVKRTKSTSNKVIYVIKKLREIGIIERFSALTQNPDKKVIIAYGASLIPVEEHRELVVSFSRELMKEDFHESINDYALDASTNGNWDMFRICAFENGEFLLKRGPDMLNSLWSKEEPKIEKAILTSVLVGKWPFHLENYRAYSKYKDL